MKRHPPEDRGYSDSDMGPLFRSSAPARAQGHSAAEAAASRASSIDHDWRCEALAAVREHCRTHERFVAEQAGIHVPPGADPRAAGAIIREAARLGYCVADGFAPTVSSRGSPKVSWRSLIYEGKPDAH